MRNPCYQCTERRIGCHAECERYIAIKEQRDQERKAAADYDIARNFLADNIRKSKAQIMRHGKK